MVGLLFLTGATNFFVSARQPIPETLAGLGFYLLIVEALWVLLTSGLLVRRLRAA